MASREPRRIMPGASVLGGAAGGLSYEGALRDAMARDEHRDRPVAAPPPGHPAPQLQASSGTAGRGDQAYTDQAYADQARHAGG